MERIAGKIEALAGNPCPRGAKKVLGGEGVFRMRVGDYRILSSLENDNRTLLVVNIDKRSRVYKRGHPVSAALFYLSTESNYLPAFSFPPHISSGFPPVTGRALRDSVAGITFTARDRIIYA